jgi:hypothetical protein
MAVKINVPDMTRLEIARTYYRVLFSDREKKQSPTALTLQAIACV